MTTGPSKTDVDAESRRAVDAFVVDRFCGAGHLSSSSIPDWHVES